MARQSDIWKDEEKPTSNSSGFSGPTIVPSSGFGLAYDPDKDEYWKNDIPDECECDNTHEANNTVCRFCWEQGLRKLRQNGYDGSQCPYCQSGNIMAVEQVQCDGPEGSQGVECHDCGRLWYDLWELKGWMEDPNNAKD